MSSCKPSISVDSGSQAACALGELLKPEVVFFGESVPKPRVERAGQRVAEAGAVLVTGLSLLVFSSCRIRRRLRQPIAAVNLGRSRADGAGALKVNRPCGPALNGLLERLGG